MEHLLLRLRIENLKNIGSPPKAGRHTKHPEGIQCEGTILKLIAKFVNHSAKAYQAQCTPDIYVFDQSQKLAYHGRPDDNWQEPENVEKRDLREAIDAIAEGKPVSETQHPSMGCSIKWK